MSTMKISRPETPKTFVDEQVSGRGFGTRSEYVCQLIQRDAERQQLRKLLLAGAESTSAVRANADYFDGLRQRVSRSERPPER